jgi:phosphatidate cytidylyltransferase
VFAGVPLGAAAIGLAYLGGPAFYAVVALAGAIMSWEWLRMTLGPTPSGRREPSFAVLGLAVILAATAASAWLRGGMIEGRATLIWLLLVVWATDSGAFFVGRALKGPRLAPRLSPKKTWSGAIGGLIAAALVALGVGHGASAAGWVSAPHSTPQLIVTGIVVGLFVEFGDLLESAAKRRYGVKDAGELIPGHGGLLDRLDGFLVAVIGLAAAIALGGAEVLWQPS